MFSEGLLLVQSVAVRRPVCSEVPPLYAVVFSVCQSFSFHFVLLCSKKQHFSLMNLCKILVIHKVLFG